MKLKWKVGEAPTGRYRSFKKRSWPSAHYVNGLPAVNITCEDAYYPQGARNGTHKPLNIRIADHSQTQWKWRVLKGEALTLEGAKQRAQAFIDSHPEVWPKT